PIAHDARIVDEDVDPAERVANLAHHRRDLLGVGDVALDARRGTDLVGNALGVAFVAALWVINIVDDALRPTRGKSADCRLADAARAAGDQNNLAREIEWIAHSHKSYPNS